MGSKKELVLGIETSCDDTSVALWRDGHGVVAHKVLGNPRTHARYKGIVPELASRDHVTSLLPMVGGLVREHGRPNAIACTTGPGLAGCLAVGVGLAQSLARGWSVPLAQVNHLAGHLLSPLLGPGRKPGFPYTCLLVSGGHTALYDVAGHARFKRLGTTVDDAAGEAFDKTGMLLGLGFPGGAQLERLASKGKRDAVRMSPAMRKHGNLNFSFSGLKTEARHQLARGHEPADVALAFQEAAIETLALKVGMALGQGARKRLAVVGGVCRNASLRKRLAQVAASHDADFFVPAMRWCTDNAAMIAYAGSRGPWSSGRQVRLRPRWPLAERGA